MTTGLTVPACPTWKPSAECERQTRHVYRVTGPFYARMPVFMPIFMLGGILLAFFLFPHCFVQWFCAPPFRHVWWSRRVMSSTTDKEATFKDCGKDLPFSVHFLKLLQPLRLGLKSVAILGSTSIFILQICAEKDHLKIVPPALMIPAVFAGTTRWEPRSSRLRLPNVLTAGRLNARFFKNGSHSCY